MIERAVILSTGDELTTGRVVDTNSSAIADRPPTSGMLSSAPEDLGQRRTI